MGRYSSPYAPMSNNETHVLGYGLMNDHFDGSGR